MKRLQLRHHNEIFTNSEHLYQNAREEAEHFLYSLVNPNPDSISETENSNKFGGVKCAEPIVLEYLDEEGNLQVILAIGNSEENNYHFIDTGLLKENIAANADKLVELSDAVSGNGESIDNILDELGDVKDNIEELSGSVITGIESIGNTIAEEISALSGNVATEIENATNELDGKISSLEDVVNNNNDVLLSDVENLSAITASLASEIQAVSSQADSALATAKNELIELIATTSGETLSQAKDYTDDKIDDINASKVVDVVYTDPSQTNTNNGTVAGRIQLALADGTFSNGFDASSFLLDSVLTDVEFDETTQSLTFVWNDQHSSRVVIPLSALSHTYSINGASATYLKLEGNEFKAIVDEDGGYGKTLATTEYARAKAEEAADDAVERSAVAISANTRAIEILNGSKDVDGSVRHIIDDKFAKDVLTAGTPATSVSLEEARAHSLVRKLTIDGVDKFYVSSDAADMQFVTSAGTRVNLNQYITALENRVTELEAENADLEQRVTALEENPIDEETIKDIVKSYLIGTEREIKITDNGNNLKVGFADDAVFGEYLATS